MTIPHPPSDPVTARNTARRMTDMQPAASRPSNRYELYLDGLRDHPTLGRPVRFYFRRREQLLYLVVGAWNTFFGYAVWALLQYLLGDYLNYLVIIVLAWPIAVLNAYIGYRYIVFRSQGSVVTELPRFSLVYLSALIANLVLLPIALRVLPLSIYVVQALVLGLVVVCSYLGHKYYSFRDRQREDPLEADQYDPTPLAKD
jgi:putative flippase GtrA